MRRSEAVSRSPPASIVGRVAERDWSRIASELSSGGNAILPGLLETDECARLRQMYAADDCFRSRVVMARHNFGRGEYKYFAYPLPDPIAQLRAALYSRLVPIANLWHEALRVDTRFPTDHAQFLDQCHRNGQTRPTPLLLRYGEGDYNCLHQDVYGENVFPLQVACLLSVPQVEFTGGELVLTEQRPRMQSRAEVVPLEQGDAAVFAVQHRPVAGARGSYRVSMRHGVSRLRSGERLTLGIIFHDAA